MYDFHRENRKANESELTSETTPHGGLQMKSEMMACGESYEKHLTHTLTLFNNKF
jgi:hypothetical protein